MPVYFFRTCFCELRRVCCLHFPVMIYHVLVGLQQKLPLGLSAYVIVRNGFHALVQSKSGKIPDIIFSVIGFISTIEWVESLTFIGWRFPLLYTYSLALALVVEVPPGYLDLAPDLALLIQLVNHPLVFIPFMGNLYLVSALTLNPGMGFICLRGLEGG